MLDTKFCISDFVNKEDIYMSIKNGLLHTKISISSLINIYGFITNNKLKLWGNFYLHMSPSKIKNHDN
jgi:hypothetical protein